MLIIDPPCCSEIGPDLGEIKPGPAGIAATADEYMGQIAPIAAQKIFVATQGLGQAFEVEDNVLHFRGQLIHRRSSLPGAKRLWQFAGFVLSCDIR
ncbi:MAG: hypothetical protein JRH08_00885 [Deltaproteobacteria bacterium]|nr:hypothetical protein [Deltaproteobacteria bacterium]MBW2025718.1 hypothetical protein [Deltaproteobacteria bacterium]MBW2124259.1 hypothetical protein [Deltaproteobacteria bacterium]